jgi:hypothetical protein
VSATADTARGPGGSARRLASPAELRCAQHPGARAVDACARCGTYVCLDCCHGCHAKASRKAAQSRRATLALVCGLLSIHGCLPLGAVAVLVGVAEVRAIERGQAPLAGRNLAIGGIALGALGTALFLGLLVVAAALFSGAT